MYYSDMFKQSTHWICEILECLLLAYFCCFNQTIIILLFKCLCRLQLTHYYKRNSYSCRYEVQVIQTLIYMYIKQEQKEKLTVHIKLLHFDTTMPIHKICFEQLKVIKWEFLIWVIQFFLTRLLIISENEINFAQINA